MSEPPRTGEQLASILQNGSMITAVQRLFADITSPNALAEALPAIKKQIDAAFPREGRDNINKLVDYEANQYAQVLDTSRNYAVILKEHSGLFDQFADKKIIFEKFMSQLPESARNALKEQFREETRKAYATSLQNVPKQYQEEFIDNLVKIKIQSSFTDQAQLIKQIIKENNEATANASCFLNNDNFLAAAAALKQPLQAIANSTPATSYLLATPEVPSIVIS